MEFRTKVSLPPSEWEIRHGQKLLLMGSCFAEHMGRRLDDSKFSCNLNPFGILYNPASIARALNYILVGTSFSVNDLMKYDDRWISLMHHGDFSAASPETCLAKINGRITQTFEMLGHADWLILTWGTAWVYLWKETGKVVGNCHRIPAANFERRRLNVDEIVDDYQTLIEKLRQLNPNLKILLTISPIRHLKDGLTGNQLSKSTLLLAADKLCAELTDCYYFPAYEIMMDDLRDYRFYADDMVHPSDMAVNYIWEQFSTQAFRHDTAELINRITEIKKAVEHRPFDAEGVKYQTFVSQILLKISRLKEKFPFLDFKNEEMICQARLKR